MNEILRIFITVVYATMEYLYTLPPLDVDVFLTTTGIRASTIARFRRMPSDLQRAVKIYTKLYNAYMQYIRNNKDIDIAHIKHLPGDDTIIVVIYNNCADNFNGFFMQFSSALLSSSALDCKPQKGLDLATLLLLNLTSQCFCGAKLVGDSVNICTIYDIVSNKEAFVEIRIPVDNNQ